MNYRVTVRVSVEARVDDLEFGEEPQRLVTDGNVEVVVSEETDQAALIAGVDKARLLLGERCGVS